MPQVTGDTRVQLDLSLNQINVLLSALTTQEWRVVNELIVDIRGQIQRQVQPETNVQDLRPGAAD